MPKVPPDVAAVLAMLPHPIAALSVEQVGTRTTTITNVTKLDNGDTHTGTSQSTRPVLRVCMIEGGDAICTIL